MQAKTIANEYGSLVKSNFPDQDFTLILYGSTVYGIKTSDLDICFVNNGEIDREIFKRLRDLTLEFHIKNGLRIDEEIAYEDKLVYPSTFVESAVQHIPFSVKDGRYYVDPIVKSKEFLSSETMKKRLILNILTVKREVLLGNSGYIESLSLQAWEEIIRVVTSYCGLSEFDAEEFTGFLIRNPFTGEKGEMYLGYKDNLPEKVESLMDDVDSNLKRLSKQRKMKIINGKYVPDENWLGVIE